jgi:hypothetical protein
MIDSSSALVEVERSKLIILQTPNVGQEKISQLSTGPPRLNSRNIRLGADSAFF